MLLVILVWFWFFSGGCGVVFKALCDNVTSARAAPVRVQSE